MSRLAIILLSCVTLLLICTACKDKDVYSDSSDVSSKDNNSSIVTESQGGSVTDNSTASGNKNNAATNSGTVSTIVDEIILNEPTSSVITAIDLETGEEVQVTVTSKPTSSADGASSNPSPSSSTTAPSSSEQQSSSGSETPPEQSSSSVSSVDPNRDTMEGFTPWK